MGRTNFNEGHFRKIWTLESEEFHEHLLRLDKDSRRMRFGAVVSDEWISDYAPKALEEACRVWGYFGPRGNLRATAELRIMEAMPGYGEAAFTVEHQYQGIGVGTELMQRVIRSARNRDLKHLYITCLADNLKMQTIARKFDGELSFDHGEVECDLTPTGSRQLSRLSEVIEDSSGIVFTVFDLQNRWIDAV